MHNYPNNIHHKGLHIHQTICLPYMMYKGRWMDSNGRDTLHLYHYQNSRNKNIHTTVCYESNT